ncbi:hypothetical protein [Oceaniglobus roseus]|uniref:hypothetical protein n=1 Tax=Oceaniglobus roseus TaxID=1737570 RepID=UPI003182EBCA
MSKQTQGTMLMVGALAGTVGFVAFVALMVVGDYNFSPALFLAAFVAIAVAVVLVLGFHRKPSDRSLALQTRAPAPNVAAPTATSSSHSGHGGHPGHSGHATETVTPSQMKSESPSSDTGRSAAEMAPAPDASTAAAVIDTPEATGSSSEAQMHRVAPGEEKKPETLDAPREGGADDLKRIKGIGPKLEELCHSMGFYHYDQIAAWTPAEVAWVDDHLEGFKGRVSRDAWVSQAKVLASGEETEFSRRVGDGGVH